MTSTGKSRRANGRGVFAHSDVAKATAQICLAVPDGDTAVLWHGAITLLALSPSAHAKSARRLIFSRTRTRVEN